MHELMTTKVVSRQFILNELYASASASLLELLASFDCVL